MNVLDTTLSEATEICDSNADGINILENVPSQLVDTWVYNISNPADYLQGGNAEVHELGVYAFEFQPTLENIEVNDDILEFDQYHQDIQFKKKDSCDSCDKSDQVFVQFTPYSTLVGKARNEAIMLMSMTCSPAQIQLMSSSDPSIGYCEESEMKTGTACRCCAQAPTENATTCSEIASPSSKAGGLLSWISKYEGGFQLSASVNSNFMLSSGDFTSLVRHSNIQEIATGHSSCFMGFFQMNRALQSGDTATQSFLAQTTEDMKDACTPLGYCPTLSELLAQIAGAGSQAEVMGIIKGIDCSGIIPSAEILEEDFGLSKSRAMELRYLEGNDCRPYGLTLAAATIIASQAGAGSMSTCANSSHSAPCCMSSFSSPSLGNGAALGCLGWNPGLIQVRNLYSLEEASANIKPFPHTQSYTACADETRRFNVHMWQGRSSWNSWFTPENYVYPNMPWADHSIVSGAEDGSVDGNYSVFDVHGTMAGIRKGRGITTDFLEYDLTDGEPINKKENVWAPFRLSPLEFEHVDSFEYSDLQVAYYRPLISTSFSDAEIEDRQRNGEMPYPNQKNVAYAKGAPVVLGYPNFYKVNSEILSQSSNAPRVAPDGAEIHLFRTRDGYDQDAQLLSTPERITTASLEEFGQEYEGDIVVEPATGVTLDANVVTMISNYIWQCDPRLDSSCGLVASAYDPSDPLCYIFGNGKHMPCSSSNVFTPKVHGGKVMPLFWIRSLISSSDKLDDRLVHATDTRYALSICVIILPVLFLVGFVLSVIQVRKAFSTQHAEGKELVTNNL